MDQPRLNAERFSDPHNILLACVFLPIEVAIFISIITSPSFENCNLPVRSTLPVAGHGAHERVALTVQLGEQSMPVDATHNPCSMQNS
jgi:hypothetical protein